MITTSAEMESSRVSDLVKQVEVKAKQLEADLSNKAVRVPLEEHLGDLLQLAAPFVEELNPEAGAALKTALGLLEVVIQAEQGKSYPAPESVISAPSVPQVPPPSPAPADHPF
jgi:hypothetical protein